MNPINEVAQMGGSDPRSTSGGTPITVVTAEGEGRLSVTEAARALAGARSRSKDQEAQRQSDAMPPAIESSAASAALEDAGERQLRDSGEQAPPGEADRADPTAITREDGRERPDALPPIEPPRSWTKADKELFTSLPRETQERIAEREQLREGDFLRHQAEAAEMLRGLTAREQAADQVKLHYETALPHLLQTLQDQQAGEFADIKSMVDVERLAREDWPRYLAWDAANKRAAFVQQQMLEAQQRRLVEQRHRFSEFAKRQDELFREKVPDIADVKKATELQGAVMNVLRDVGFDETELAASWQGLRDLSLRDHRVQLLVRDATLWREAQQKARAAAARPVPPVQRPGVSQPRGAAQDAVIQNLNKQLENASGVNALRTAAKLVAARRETRRA
jgi:hypothetical protein